MQHIRLFLAVPVHLVRLDLKLLEMCLVYWCTT